MRRTLVPLLAVTGLSIGCGPPIPTAIPTALPARSAAMPAQSGAKLFIDSGCGGCHTLAGVPGATGVAGPNLTNIALRPTLAGETIPNTPDTLARWLVDPSGVKPGATMPRVGLSTAEAQEVAAFLFAQPNAP